MYREHTLIFWLIFITLDMQRQKYTSPFYFADLSFKTENLPPLNLIYSYVFGDLIQI